MAEEEKVDAAATETAETTAVKETTETPKPPAEAKKTEARADRFDAPVPYARFREVIQDRNALREENERLKATPAARATKADDEDTTMIEARKLIQTEVRAMLEQEGVPLSKVKQVLAASDVLAAESAESKWERICAKTGVDPTNADIQDFVGGALQRGVDLSDAMSRAVKVFGQVKRTASVEADGVTPHSVRSDLKIFDKKAANDAAAKGIRGAHVGVEEIVSRIQKERAQR